MPWKLVQLPVSALLTQYDTSESIMAVLPQPLSIVHALRSLLNQKIGFPQMDSDKS